MRWRNSTSGSWPKRDGHRVEVSAASEAGAAAADSPAVDVIIEEWRADQARLAPAEHAARRATVEKFYEERHDQ